MSPVPLVHVDHLDDPRLDPYRNQRDAWLAACHNPAVTKAGMNHADHGLFMAEGGLVIESLLASRYPIHSILATPERFATIQTAVEAAAPETPVFLATRSLLEQVVGFDLHRGLLAAGRRLPPTPPAEVIARSRVLVLAEDLSNHDNVGGLFRTIAGLAGEAAGVLLSARCCDPLYRKALRVSIGHALRTPWARVDAWPTDLDAVLAAGFRILALSPSARTPVHRLDLGRGEKVAILIGAEGPGLSPETFDWLGSRVESVSIPMRGGVDSLNVVVAMGIVLDRVMEGVEK